MPPTLTKSKKPGPAPTRPAELENSRLGVIFFLGNLQVDFSPEKSASEMSKKVTSLIQDKIGSGKISSAAQKVGGLVGAIEKQVDDIAASIQKFLVDKFNFAPSDAELAVQHVRYNLPGLILGIKSAVGKDDYPITGIASGLYKGITKTIEYFSVRSAGDGVTLESGHPDIVATSIRRSIVKSALVGLAEAALEGAKVALAAFTSGVGIIINKVAGVIEQLLRFAVRFCDALTLRKIFADAKQKWSSKGQTDAIQKNQAEFAAWFKKCVDRAPIVAALVMNCGIAGDAMRFLQVATSSGVVVTQGQFDKGVTYLNKLKSSAGDLIMECQKEMRIWTNDKMCAALLKHAGEIGLVQKEAGSSWRSKIFVWTHKEGKASQALNFVLDKAGYKQSSLLHA